MAKVIIDLGIPKWKELGVVWKVVTFLHLVQLLKLQPTEISVSTGHSSNPCAINAEATRGSNTTSDFGYIPLRKLLTITLATNYYYILLKLQIANLD